LIDLNLRGALVKKVLLVTILLVLPALAADDAAKANKPLPQDSQIKLLKAQRQFQQIQMQMSSLQRQFDQAVKDGKDLQAQMANDCAAASKEANVDLTKFTCDLDSLTFVPRTEEKKAERSLRRKNSRFAETG
jgi:peptidoglycan hydrolase CwlO-like protein